MASGSTCFLQYENAGRVIPRQHSFEDDEILLSIRDQRVFDPGAILTGCDLAKVWGDRCQLFALAIIQKPGQHGASYPVYPAGRNRRVQALDITPRAVAFLYDDPIDRLSDPRPDRYTGADEGDHHCKLGAPSDEVCRAIERFDQPANWLRPERMNQRWTR